jgi:GNAT superfamily N-acetyltransferase
MTAEIRVAVRADAEPLALLHRESLPSSLLTSLGLGALVRYYRFVATSSCECVWSAVVGGDVVGGCVLSEAPDTVMRRFGGRAPFQLGRELARQVIVNNAFRARLLAGLRGGGGDEKHAPEVTQIFTDGKLRGQGIGAQLLRVCEESLRTRGVQKYFVHTERDDNQAGIRFYLREGFVQIGQSVSFGEHFLVMQKDL